MKDITQKLEAFNEFGKTRFAEISPDFRNHIHILGNIYLEIKAIMHHLKSIESKLGKKYPVAYNRAQNLFPLPKDLCEN